MIRRVYVGWQVTLCDPIWQMTLRSFETGFPWRIIPFNHFDYVIYCYVCFIGIHRCAVPVRHHGQPVVNRCSLLGPTQPRGHVPTPQPGRGRYFGPTHRFRPAVDILRHTQRTRVLPPVHPIRHTISQKGFFTIIMINAIVIYDWLLLSGFAEQRDPGVSLYADEISGVRATLAAFRYRLRRVQASGPTAVKNSPRAIHAAAVWIVSTFYLTVSFELSHALPIRQISALHFRPLFSSPAFNSGYPVVALFSAEFSDVSKVSK